MSVLPTHGAQSVAAVQQAERLVQQGTDRERRSERAETKRDTVELQVEAVDESASERRPGEGDEQPKREPPQDEGPRLDVSA